MPTNTQVDHNDEYGDEYGDEAGAEENPNQYHGLFKVGDLNKMFLEEDEQLDAEIKKWNDRAYGIYDDYGDEYGDEGEGYGEEEEE